MAWIYLQLLCLSLQFTMCFIAWLDNNQFQGYLFIVATVTLMVLKLTSLKTFIEAP